MKHSAIREDWLSDVVDRLPDNGLRAMRAVALRKFLRTGLPKPSHEDWRYTNLQPAIAIGNAWLGEAAGIKFALENTDEDFAKQDCEQRIDAQWLRFLNGQITGSSELYEEVSGIGIKALSSTRGEDAELHTDDPLSSFNAALLVDAIKVSVANGVSLQRPIGLLLANAAAAIGGLSTCRILIEVGQNATVDIIESHLSIVDSKSFANVVVELRLGPGARVNYLRMQECGDAAIVMGQLVASIGESASLKYSSLDLGGSLVRNDVNVLIGSAGAEFSAAGLYLASGAQHIDNHLRVDHKAGPTRSQAEFRGILHGSSRCVFNSKAIVHEGADGTDACQSNHNLLLSESAEIDTKPELEIYADDVKCAHGATVGQLDKSALFYLRSRGIDEDAATSILTRAFAASIVGELSVGAAAEYVSDKVDRRLDALIAL